MNNKGSITDLVYILVSLFTFAFITIMMFNVYGNYTEQVNKNPAFNNTVTQGVQADAVRTLELLDYVFIFFLIVFVMLTVVSSFAIRTHPLFFFISVLLLVLVIMLGAIFSNVYEEIVGTDEFSDSEFTIVPFIMSHLPTVVLVIGAILIVVLYAKNRWEEG